MLALDHVVIAVPDLDSAGTTLLDRDGLASFSGGAHEGGTTANRIIPLHGGAYLELLAVVDAIAAPASPLGRLVAHGVGSGHRLIAWAVRTDDIDVVAARLGLDVVAMGRSRPDGTRLTWRVAGIQECVATRFLPFFIQWDQADLHPAVMRGTDRVDAPRIEAIELAADEARLRAWLGTDAILPGVQLVDAEDEEEMGIRSLTVATGGRRIQLGGPGWVA